MSILSWMRDKLSLKDYKGWSKFLTTTWAGRPVTLDGSLQLSAWWRSVKLYAEVTGATSLKFYERKDDDERVQVRDHPIAEIISIDPNIDQTPQEFWGCQAASLALIGNAFSEKRFVGSRLVSLQPMPIDTTVRRNADDELEYTFSDRGKSTTLPRDKVFHTRGFMLGNGDVGLSPLGYARQALGISLATEEATGKTFAHGMRGSGFFSMPPGTKLEKTQREDFEKTYISPMIGNDADVQVGLLPPGFEFKPISISAKDAEMLLSRRFNIEDICRFMGVPPILVGHQSDGQTMWGSGVENIILAWLTLGLDAFLRNIEWSISKRLLSPLERRRFYAEFDRNSLLRADSEGKAEFISKMIQNAQMTPNEGRKKENRPPMPGGNQLFVNSTLVPLSQAGQRPARVQPAPGEPIPEPEP